MADFIDRIADRTARHISKVIDRMVADLPDDIWPSLILELALRRLAPVDRVLIDLVVENIISDRGYIAEDDIGKRLRSAVEKPLPLWEPRVITNPDWQDTIA